MYVSAGFASRIRWRLLPCILLCYQSVTFDRMNDIDILSLIGLNDELADGLGWIPGLDAECKAIEAESIGWAPLELGAYLHLASVTDADAQLVIEVVGSITADMASMNVLLVT
jgi:hypothetical protein